MDVLTASFATAAAYLASIGATVNWPAVAAWVALPFAVIAIAVLFPVLAVTLTAAATVFAAVIGMILTIYGIFLV